jgi:hypothetical protein
MKPLFVSLGESCCVRHQMNIWAGMKSYETQLFDWLVTSFDTVNKVLSVSDPSIIFNKDTIYKYCNFQGMSEMRCTELDTFRSIHDLSRNYSDRQYNELIDELHRRWYRLIDNIRSGKYIIFIHYGLEGFASTTQQEKFFSYLDSINSDHNCYLVSCCYTDQELPPNNNIGRFYTFNFADYPIRRASDNWTKDMYDWKSLFETPFR